MRGICCNINHLDLINKVEIDENSEELAVVSKIKKSTNAKPKIDNNEINTSTTSLTNNFNKNIIPESFKVYIDNEESLIIPKFYGIKNIDRNFLKTIIH